MTIRSRPGAARRACRSHPVAVSAPDLAACLPMRRHELERLGIQLPALATIALGGLPGPPDWAQRLVTIGVDVVSSGALHDTPDTVAAAVAAAPYRAVKATAPTDPAAVAAAGARIFETAGPVPGGVYRFGPDEAMVVVVDGADPDVEDPNIAARVVVEVARAVPPSALWVVASPGLDRLSVARAEQKLTSLYECAYRARLVFAKEQFTSD